MRDDDGKEVYGGTIYVTSAATITPPAVLVRMSVTVVTIGAVAVSVDTNASDRMYLDGTALEDGDKATNTSTTGDIIHCKHRVGTLSEDMASSGGYSHSPFPCLLSHHLFSLPPCCPLN